MLKNLIQKIDEMSIEKLTEILKDEGIKFVPKEFFNTMSDQIRFNIINTKINSKVVYGKVEFKNDFLKIKSFSMTEFEGINVYDVDSKKLLGNEIYDGAA